MNPREEMIPLLRELDKQLSVVRFFIYDCSVPDGTCRVECSKIPVQEAARCCQEALDTLKEIQRKIEGA